MVAVSTAVYIDGFNFYYGAARPHGIRWVDLRRMSQRILGPRHAVEQVYLYTAPLHDRVSDGRAAWRHDLFLRAVQAQGGVEIVLGTHVVGQRRLPLLLPDGRAGALVTVLQTTEKGTDVNLAVDLVHHVLCRRWSAAAVVSNDGDLARAVRIARTEGGVPIGVINPHQGRQSRHLAEQASFMKTIRRSDLAKSRLPNRLQDASGAIEKPEGW
ncbi:MAG: NYN domain-containing protein [Planctomycetota bacterium]|jgi:uncharacterized LabA/DUF88 family protein|nr:NYN domain-containing protein [Planctomycetota bacterium]